MSVNLINNYKDLTSFLKIFYKLNRKINIIINKKV